jgi:hypothetical protein
VSLRFRAPLQKPSQWKKAVDDREAESKKSNPVYKKRTLLKKSTEPSNVKLTEKT